MTQATEAAPSRASPKMFIGTQPLVGLVSVERQMGALARDPATPPVAGLAIASTAWLKRLRMMLFSRVYQTLLWPCW